MRMATGGLAQTSTATQDPGATLRQGYMASLRTRTGRAGRVAMLSLPMMQAAPTMARDVDEMPQRDRVAELQTNRHAAQRYQTPSASMPQLQSLSENLHEDGDDDDLTAAYDLDESIQDMSEEASQADDLSMLSRVKSQWNAKKEEGMQKMMDKGRKKLEKVTANLKTEGTAKFASAADQGEGFEVADLAGTAVSVGHATLSIFQDSFDETAKDMLAKKGLPMLQMSDPLDVAVVAGTNVQVLWTSFKIVVLIPFCVIFLVMSAISACHESFICKNGVGLLSTVSNFLGT
jgi:hypothetical protein